MAESGGSKVGQVFIFPINAGCENWQFNIQTVNILVRILIIHFHHKRGFGGGAAAHWLAFQLHALGLDGLHKIHKGFSANYADIFLRAAGIHFAQTSAKSLFRQNIAFGGIGPQADNGRHIAHIPAFLEHQH